MNPGKVYICCHCGEHIEGEQTQNLINCPKCKRVFVRRFDPKIVLRCKGMTLEGSYIWEMRE